MEDLKNFDSICCFDHGEGEKFKTIFERVYRELSRSKKNLTLLGSFVVLLTLSTLSCVARRSRALPSDVF